MAKLKIKRAEDEPDPTCSNCDYYDTGKCIARTSIWFNFNPQPTDGCEKFWPDHKRWRNVDDD